MEVIDAWERSATKHCTLCKKEHDNLCVVVEETSRVGMKSFNFGTEENYLLQQMFYI